MRTLGAGHAVFALTMIGVGILGSVRGDFMQIWQPVPGTFPARQVLVWPCAAISPASSSESLRAITVAQWREFTVSWVLTAPAWVVAGSCRGAVRVIAGQTIRYSVNVPGRQPVPSRINELPPRSKP